jgi:tetratricopeptide (TPR) repeat protein
VQTNEQEPTESSKADQSNEIGTFVFGAFAVIALVVSIVKGIVPIYLFESAVWAGAAWYWHSKQTHSELAKAIVIVIAALIAIGEVVQVAREFNKPSTAPASRNADPFEKYRVPSGSSTTPYSTYVPAANPDQTAAPTGSALGSDIAEIEQKAISLYKQKRYVDARPLFVQSCDGGEMKACNYLGYLYAKGLGGARDTKKARDVYQRACDQGTLSSCASLGSLYQDAGNGEEARKYFNKACQGGLAEACVLLRGVQ